LAKKYPSEIQAILNKPVIIRCGRFGYQNKTLNNEYWAKFTDYGSNPDKWKIYPLPNGHLIIKSLKDGKNLQAMPGGATRCHNHNEKEWEWFDIEFIKNEFFIVSRHTNKVLQCDFFGNPNTSNYNRQNWEALHIYSPDSK
jgi:hypothetical protein